VALDILGMAEAMFVDARGMENTPFAARLAFLGSDEALATGQRAGRRREPFSLGDIMIRHQSPAASCTPGSSHFFFFFIGLGLSTASLLARGFSVWGFALGHVRTRRHRLPNLPIPINPWTSTLHLIEIRCGCAVTEAGRLVGRPW